MAHGQSKGTNRKHYVMPVFLREASLAFLCELFLVFWCCVADFQKKDIFQQSSVIRQLICLGNGCFGSVLSFTKAQIYRVSEYDCKGRIVFIQNIDTLIIHWIWVGIKLWHTRLKLNFHVLVSGSSTSPA